MSDATLPIGLEPFNGYRKLHNVLIPVSLGPVSIDILTWFDKFLYGQLRFGAGNSDRCNVVFAHLANELVVSEASIARSVERMVTAGLLFRKRQRYCSLIVFLRSELLDGSLPKSQRSESTPLHALERDTESTSESTLNANQESTTESSLSDSRVDTAASESRHRCKSESTAVSSAYKEDLGFSLGVRRNKPESTAQDCAFPSTKIFDAAWKRHLKYRGRGEHQQKVIQILMGKTEPIDWNRFTEVHPAYCDYWLNRGWDFCSLTLLDWFEAGMPAPPPPPASKTDDAWARFDEPKPKFWTDPFEHLMPKEDGDAQ